MKYRWTVNLLASETGQIKSVSVIATTDLDVLAKTHSRYPGYIIVFLARMEAITS